MGQLNDIDKQSIKRAWALGDTTLKKLAEKYHCSVPTIRRAVQGVKKGSAKQARVAKAIADAATQQLAGEIAIRSAESIDDATLFNLLKEISYDALSKGKELNYSSAGEAVSAGIRGLQALRSLYPMTMREAAEWIVNLPGFNAREFARLLREVWSEKHTS